MKMTAFIALFCLYATAQDLQPVREFVWTDLGFIRGQTDGVVDQFLGVPYAAPPIGDLRWKAPADAPRWTGVLDATKFGSPCVQAGPAIGGQAIVGSEDCLYLNVYRPAAARPRDLLPVLMFIHGGSNQKGAGSDYDPSQMVAKTGIIVVTINYRLNVFGFLAHPSLDAEAGEPSSGNFGLLDQQAAMRWVRANILGFGGNPLNVTLDGESAGGIDICANLVSPQAAGLFNRAILESMYCPNATHDEALQVSAPVTTALGCADLACMRAAAAADIFNAAGNLSGEPGGGNGFNASPNYGSSVLPMDPSRALSAGQWNWSSILIGSNHDEAAFWIAPALLAAKVKFPVSEQAYQAIVETQFGSFAPNVLSEYSIADYPSPFMRYADISTDDSPLGCSETPLSQSFAALTQTFRYEFNDPNAPTAGANVGLPSTLSLGADHGSELQYLFKMTQLPGPQTGAQKQLSDQMMLYWANFARTGNPNGEGLPGWPRYDAANHQILSLRPDGSRILDTFDTDHHCAFWATAPPSRGSGITDY